MTAQGSLDFDNQPVRKPEPPEDICRNYHGGNPESEAANESIRNLKEGLRGRIIGLLKSSGPMTSDDIEARTGMRHQTVSARLAEMKKSETIVQAGRKQTRSGRWAAAWAVK